jgi:rare lipoprotein A
MKFLTLLLLVLSALPSAAISRLNTALPKTEGLASFYGRREQGKRTASGERFDRHKFTCASRFYPLGTLLMVKYPRMGTFVVVRVTDKGPWIEGRILDLAERPARVLGLYSHGVDFVEITPVYLNWEIYERNSNNSRVLSKSR